MNDMVVPFTEYANISNEAARDRIEMVKSQLDGRAIILAHHYQREDVYMHADMVGDSFKLAKLAGKTDTDFLVFCGVHFMAEVADILSKNSQTVILPDLAAGCSMADMANLAKVERAWRELSVIFPPDQFVTPVTYINSAADLKAFCGRHDGVVCTSSNAGSILDWAFRRKEKVLFFPDQHLGRWAALQKGVALQDMFVWDPDLPQGGLTKEQLKSAKVLLWKGHCSVHQMFQPQHIIKFREKNPDGMVISHPECRLEVCQLSDHVGSTEFIVNTIRDAPTGTHWLVGTELNLVNRLAKEFKPEGKIVQFMSPLVCMCSTMNRIDPQHLAWCLENLASGRVMNQISVTGQDKEEARLALDAMLSIV